ncbi:MAG: 4-hydroxy-tetrahydrodipicolinate synthase [Ignavibacteria bacterium]|nr:4-hydroxy-tetrahydrodipicolinate synthase [Ignavibacteria bacterium]
MKQQTILFRGTGTALITPFTKKNTIDERALRRLIDYQIEGGVEAILPIGTTGESATLTEVEMRKVVEIVVAHNNKRKIVIAGTGTNSTMKTLALSKKARDIGVDGLLIVGPYYNKPTQEGFYQHYANIAEHIELPIIIYNVPSRTGSNITAETTLKLAETFPNIVGIKEASGNFEQIMEILRNRPKQFALYSGDDAVTLPMIALGGDGVVSVIANQAPKMFSEMVRLCLQEKFRYASALHYQLLPLMNFNFIESNPIPVKTSLAMMGLIEENFRLPLIQLSSRNRPKLEEILKNLKLIS